MNHKPYGIYEKYVKRPLDAFLSAIGLIVLSPVLIVTAILVRMKLGSPVIFAQERPGKIDPKTGEEKIFTLYKFRTMTDKRDENGNLLPDEERLTTFGKKLRSTSIDELPELFNILKGDMSFVGPRPLLMTYLPYYTKKERHRHDVRPGLTGAAQIRGRNFLNWKARFEKDIFYVNHITFLGDMDILRETVVKVFTQDDVMQADEDKASMSFDDLDKERTQAAINVTGKGLWR